MIDLQDRPPHVRFEYRPVEDRKQTIEAGHPVYRDVEFAIITPHGGSLVLEQEVTDEHKRRFDQQYKAWKAGEDAPISGSPLRMWPPITPAFLETCKGLNILAVEDLAAANEQTLDKLGIGARAWKEKARAWLESADSHGKPAERIAALEVKVEQLEELIKEKDKAISYWKAAAEGEKPKGRPPREAA